MNRQRALISVLFILVVLAAAAVTAYRDYGASWDEPKHYEYARSIRYAYTLEDRLEQDFRIDKAYADPWYRYYGPAYLLLGGSLVEGLKHLIPGSTVELWHLVNFLTFLAGGACLYGLARRWVSPLASLGAMLLYLLQPLLWGHAFINPKDTPFTTFFLAAVLAGYIMVDATAPHRQEAATPRPGSGRGPALGLSHPRWWPVLWLGLALVLLILCRDLLLTSVDVVVRISYEKPGSLPGLVLRSISPNVQVLPIEAYLRKAGFIALLVRMALLFGAAAGLLIAGWRCVPPVHRRLVAITLAAGTLLGILISIRIIGPSAGLVVALYALRRPSRRSLIVLAMYAATAIGVAYATWPYLWEAPVANYFHAIQRLVALPDLMLLEVLFAGRVWSSDSPPAGYLPRLMLMTLTEPTVILAALGGIGLARRSGGATRAAELLPIVLWFALPFGYFVATSQSAFDQYRHILFILPPVFILAGLGLERILSLARPMWFKCIILALSVAPGILGIGLLHPYEYTYYNTLSGGMAAASRRYETDYWLTCYREAMTSPSLSDIRSVYVYPEVPLASLYARPGTIVYGYDRASPPTDIREGSALLLSTRANLDLSVQPSSPILLEVSRQGAPFCVVKALIPTTDPPGD